MISERSVSLAVCCWHFQEAAGVRAETLERLWVRSKAKSQCWMTVGQLFNFPEP